MKLFELKKHVLEKLNIEFNKEYEVNLILQDVARLSLNDIHFNRNIDLDDITVNRVFEFIDRRNVGEPYNYILNYKEFFNRIFYIDNRVLIPRPETEILVEECIKRNKNKKINRYLDMCTGSGCIGITLSKELDISDTILSDISKEALQVCDINCKKYNVNANIIESDLFDNIDGKFDLITINPPYVPLLRKDSLDETVVKFEPNIALFSGDDGMDIISKIIGKLDRFMSDESSVYIEFDETHAELIKKLIDDSKFNYKIFKDYSDMDRFIIIERRKNC